MKNTIIKLFNLEPDELEDVQFISEGNIAFILITLKRVRQRCPQCGSSTKVVHDYRKRTLTHAILNDQYTSIVFNQRRYRCTNCNKQFSEANPFTFPHKRMSAFTILQIMKMLKNPHVTFAQVADAMHLSSTTVIRIFEKYAGINAIPLPESLCIDEIYSTKYKQKVYACVMADMNTSQIYDLLPSRKKADLCSYFSAIPLTERSKVKYVSIDMYPVYKDVAEIYFPNAKVCVDSFHVIQLINRAFTSTRIRVMNRFDKNTEEYKLLKHFSRFLDMDRSRTRQYNVIDLHKYFHIFEGRYVSVDILIDKMLSLDIELGIVYDMKEQYSYWNRTCTIDSIASRLDNFIIEAFVYDIKELTDVAKTIRHWKTEIVNSFNHHHGRRISNGPIESVNARIKSINRNGNGYQNFERFRLRVLYSLNDNSGIKGFED